MSEESTSNNAEYSYSQLGDKLKELSDSFGTIETNVLNYQELLKSLQEALNYSVQNVGNFVFEYQYKENETDAETKVNHVSIKAETFSNQIFNFLENLIQKCKERIENENRKLKELKELTADFVNKDFDVK